MTQSEAPSTNAATRVPPARRRLFERTTARAYARLRHVPDSSIWAYGASRQAEMRPR